MKQIKHFFNKKLLTIFFLGIASGLPLSLVLSTLKAMLTDKGFDLQTIGFFSIITAAYSLKFFFAPIIDSFSIPYLTKRLGQRRSWIIVTQLALIFSIIMLGIAGESGNLLLITIFAFCVSFSSASQDIVIDGYRIELIEQELQGVAASFYTYGYHIGLLISGAFALLLSDHFNWQIVYVLMASIMALALINSFLANETRKNWKKTNYNFINWSENYVVAPISDFIKKPQWYFVLLFIICFKLGDVFAGSLTVPFLLELQFSKTEIAAIVKSFGLVATLIGVGFGGILVKKIGVYKSLWIAGFAQMLSNLAFSYLAQIGHDSEVLYFVIFAENFSSGIGSAVFVAYLSNLCNISFSATQYAILSSFASLSRSLFASSAGTFAVALGWYNFFIFSTFLAIPGLIFLLIIRKNKHA